MSASAAIDLALMRASMLLESDPAAAAQRATEILAQAPHSSEALLLLAAARRKLGDSSAAAGVLERLCAQHPDSAAMHLELGRAYAAAGRAADALAAFNRAVTLDEGLAEGWRELAALHFAAHDVTAGDRAYAQYVKRIPEPAELSDAAVALADNRLAAAAEMLKRRLQQAPEDVVAQRLLANAARRWGDEAQAERRLRRCLEIAPGYGAARADLVRLLHMQQRSDEVLPLLERLLTQDPGNVEYLSLKAQTLRLLGRTPAAIALLEETIAQHPQDDDLWLLYGHLLRELGQQARAIEAYRRALSVRPGSGRAYWSLANLKTFRFTATELAAMQEQATLPGVRGTEKINLEFALGKALEDEAQYQASFEHYARGNALERATLPNDPDGSAAEVERNRRIFTPDFFKARSGWGSQARDPIFIVGVPRSGSTLLEQILASHSQVEGTRELAEMIGIVRGLTATAGIGEEYPHPVGQLSAAAVSELAARYLERTRLHRTLGRPRFIDKMLGNYAHVGLIQLMFPNAVIIDVRRHPLASGFACFKQLFTRPLAFTYDLREFARYYREYYELMEHFDSALPGRVHRIYYEHLITDPERQVRQLLDHCGLEFEAQCLRFYENPRAVLTISSEQVRQPLYTDSLEQWRHYEPWLGPLREPLADLAARYPPPARPAG